MKRLVSVMLCLLVVFACSNNESDTAATNATETATESHSQDAPKQMIPDTPDKPVVHAAIKPFFDDKGLVTEKTISPGDKFEVFIFAEYEEKNSMTAAEYKLVLPSGVSILSAVETDSSTLRSGKPEEDFMIAFKCAPGPKVFLVKYSCRAGQNFAGGDIRTALGDRSKFIGLVTCGHAPEQYTADTGKAILKIN